MSKDITPKGIHGPVRKALAAGNVEKLPLSSRGGASNGIQKAPLAARPAKGAD